MSLAGRLAAAVIVLWTLLALTQLWFPLVSMEVFLKLTLSAGLLLVVTVVVALIWREYVDERRLKRDRYID